MDDDSVLGLLAELIFGWAIFFWITFKAAKLYFHLFNNVLLVCILSILTFVALCFLAMYITHLYYKNHKKND